MTEPTGYYARISDDEVARATRQIGIPQPLRNPEWNEVADRTAISQFAFGYGDDNPLWYDDAYAARTRWRGRIAPPTFVISTGINETPPLADDERDLFRGLFRGVGRYFAGASWRFYRPIYADQHVYQGGREVVEVEERPSRLGGGRSVRDRFRIVYATAPGDVVVTRTETYVNAERGANRDSESTLRRERARYTPEQIAAIDADYAAEDRRGAEPRFIEDLRPGDALTPVVKGPLTVLDIIAMHMGIGFGLYGFGPSRYAWHLRRRAPALYTEDEYGVPDSVQRIHWDEQLAAKLGHPAPFDYGQMRMCWLTHLLTNWMGDDAWLFAVDLEARGFNYVGDTHWCRGEVTAVTIGDHGPQAEIAFRATNQEGEDTTTGTAVVLLPSREHGLSRLPVPPPDLADRAVRIVAQGSASNAEIARA